MCKICTCKQLNKNIFVVKKLKTFLTKNAYASNICNTKTENIVSWHVSKSKTPISSIPRINKIAIKTNPTEKEK